MQSIIRFGIIAAVVFVVIAYMTTDTVRFTESAVVTTFGRADKERSIRTDPGILITWPWAQRVTKYDTRARFYETRPETAQTRDDKQIVVTTFITWRVSDPLTFYNRFSNAGSRADDHFREAERAIRPKLRSAMNEIGRYRLDELLSSRPGESRLPELEERMLAAMRAGIGSDAALADYGIEPMIVGFSSVTFPQDTTREVFAAMGQNRTRIANEAQSQGSSRAQTIRDAARADAQRITVFAEALAQGIRGQGDQEAARFVAEMNEDPQLAIFLQNMNFIREAFGRSTTLVLPTNIPGMEMFRPDAFRNAGSGRTPAPSVGAFDGAVPAALLPEGTR